MTARFAYLTMLSYLLLAFCGQAMPVFTQRSPVPVIDVHTHFLPLLVPGRGLNFDSAVDSAVQTMDRFGIAISIVMSPPRPRSGKLNYDYPKFRAALARHGSRFKFLGGGGTLNPMLHRHTNPATVTEKVRREFANSARRAIDAGGIGFGEMSSLHISLSKGHGYSYVPADHPLLLLLADIAAERDVPLDLHMDAIAVSMRPPSRLARFPNNPKKFPATLDALDRLLSHNRKARIVWAHGGTDHLGEFSPKRIGTLMDRHSNLFVSLRVAGHKSPTRNKLISGRKLVPSWRSVLTRHSDRFVIGTDNFYVGPDLKRAGPIAGFSHANAPKLKTTQLFLSLLPANLARKIASQNAIRIYRLDAAEISPVRAVTSAETAAPVQPKGLCKNGNMAHCKIACQRGFKNACNRLKRGR